MYKGKAIWIVKSSVFCEFFLWADIYAFLLSYFNFSFFLFETMSHCVHQAGLELVVILQPEPSRGWNYRHVPSHPAFPLSFMNQNVLQLAWHQPPRQKVSAYWLWCVFVPKSGILNSDAAFLGIPGHLHPGPSLCLFFTLGGAFSSPRGSPAQGPNLRPGLPSSGSRCSSGPRQSPSSPSNPSTPEHAEVRGATRSHLGNSGPEGKSVVTSWDNVEGLLGS